MKKKTVGHSRTFRIHFVVGPDTYAVSPLKPHPDIARQAFRLRKLTGDQAIYDVQIGTTGQVECDCLGYLAHRHCKHCDVLARVCQLFSLGEGHAKI